MSNTINNNQNIFTVSYREIEERLDPAFYKPEYSNILTSQVNWVKVKNISLRIQHPPEYKRVYSDTGFQLIRSQNVRPTGLDLSESPVFLSAEFLKNKKVIFPKNGDILIVRSGVNAGDVTVIENDIDHAIIGADNLLLKPNLSKIIPKFIQIYFYTKSGRKLLNRYLTGATNKHISPYYMAKVDFPLIKMEVRQNCIKIFENGLLNKLQKELQAEQLLKSIDEYLFNELGITIPEKDNSLESRIYTTSLSKVSSERFDCKYHIPFYHKLETEIRKCQYPPTKLRDLLVFIESGSRPKGGVNKFENGIFSIGGEHVNDKCEVGYGNPKYIPFDFHKKYFKTETRLLDVILVKDGATTGKIGIIENPDFAYQNINEHVFLMRPNQEKITPLYLTYFFHTVLGQILLKREITGATVTGLTKEAVKSISIPILPIEKQKEIEEHIKQIRLQAKQLETEAIEELEKAKIEVEKIILGVK